MSSLLAKCGACGNEVSVKAVACPKCGHPNAQAPASFDPKALLSKFHFGGRGGTIAAVGFGLFAFIAFLSKNSPQPVSSDSSGYESVQSSRDSAPQRPENKFGPRPEQNQKNGPYREVSEYLRQAARDPASTEIERCSKAKFDEKLGWVVACEFMTNNARGDMAKYANWFVIRNEKVVKLLGANEYKIE